MDSIFVSETKSELSGIEISDALSVFSELRNRFDERQLFLLESAAGPERDCSQSVIGINPVFIVRVFDDHTEISAQDGLLDELRERLKVLRLSSEPGRLVMDNYLSSDPWTVLRVVARCFSSPGLSGLFGFFGYFGYDTVRFIEKIEKRISRDGASPAIELAVYQSILSMSRKDGTQLYEFHSPYWDSIDASFLHAYQAGASPFTEIAAVAPSSVSDSTTEEAYLAIVECALENIRAGDIYQIQLGHQIAVESAMNPFDVYQRLRKINPSPYMYYAAMSRACLIGASPELFIKVQGGVVSMRPIAGTVGKREGVGRQESVQSLVESDKERAEHVMLVDLCRNDIGRICKTGTLLEDEVMVVEEYSHLYHMVSNVEASLEDEQDVYDAMIACFPAGTMTGAPKVRAMELIEEYETIERGAYAGAVGLIGFDGSANLALCIRSTTFKDGVYYCRASAGVVADSVPRCEWMETLHKMGSVFLAITGKEIPK